MISGNRSSEQPLNPWLPSWDMQPPPSPMLRYLVLPPDMLWQHRSHPWSIMEGLPYPGMSLTCLETGHIALDPSHNPRFLSEPGPTITHPTRST